MPGRRMVGVFLGLVASFFVGLSSAFAADNSRHIDGTLSSDFIRWWLCDALDYSADAVHKHENAKGWLVHSIESSVSDTFWANERGVTQRIVFVCEKVAPPVRVDDSEFSLNVSGQLISAADPALAAHELQLECIVQAQPEGFRISSLKCLGEDGASGVAAFLSRPTPAQANLARNWEAIRTYQKGLALEFSGDTHGAIRQYDRALKSNPRFALVLKRRAELLITPKITRGF